MRQTYLCDQPDVVPPQSFPATLTHSPVFLLLKSLRECLGNRWGFARLSLLPKHPHTGVTESGLYLKEKCNPCKGLGGNSDVPKEICVYKSAALATLLCILLGSECERARQRAATPNIRCRSALQRRFTLRSQHCRCPRADPIASCCWKGALGTAPLHRGTAQLG